MKKKGKPRVNQESKKIEDYIKSLPDWFIHDLDNKVCNKFDIDFEKFNRHFEKVSGMCYSIYLTKESERRLTIEYGSMKNALEKAKFGMLD